MPPCKGPCCDTVHLISHGLHRAQISNSSGHQASINDLRPLSASEEIEVEIPSKIGALLIISWRESLAGRDRPSTDQEFMKGEYMQLSQSAITARLYDYHLSLLRPGPTQQSLQEVTTAPIFTMPVLEHAEAIVDGKSLPEFPQYGLLAGLADAVRENSKSDGPGHSNVQDPRIFFNGGSVEHVHLRLSRLREEHTLSYLLENCLIPSDANRLPRPLTGLVVHYDTFISDARRLPTGNTVIRESRATFTTALFYLDRTEVGWCT
ncbi:hypothetical protein V498_01627 [Pseudogymnoascus sp. VKM F-4517 (FW-2822)]|nr:hypothetical protein V498_01627 [Pseudogymnoascus sp. VKM F-4517 (FW-2822)]